VQLAECGSLTLADVQLATASLSSLEATDPEQVPGGLKD
jgi:hypothetical protein